MATEAEINSPIPKPEIFAKEYTGAKPKATLPLRVLDEEVWLSGSELKTDNSSSDEEKPGLEGLKENMTKKGARRKTKCIRTNYAKSTKTRLTEAKSKLIETSEVQEEIISSSDDSDFNYEKDVKKRKKKTDFLMTKIDEREEYSLSTNQANDENLHLQKILSLEEEIIKAEKKYTAAKKNTDEMVSKMAEYLESMDGLTEPEWIYFVDITKKWIECFRQTESDKAIMCAPKIELNENVQIHDILLPKIRNKARKLRKNYGYFKTGKMKNLRVKKTEARIIQKSSLDILLTRIETESKESSYSEPYKLTAEELSRVHEIENKLDSFRSCNSLIDSSDSLAANNKENCIQKYSSNSTSECPNIVEQKEKNDEHESEKNKINFLIRRNLSNDNKAELDEFCNDIIDEDYNSCEEVDLTSEDK